MGKSVPSSPRLQEFARLVSSNKLHHPVHGKFASRPRFVPSSEPANPREVRVESERLRREKMEENSEIGEQRRPVPLSHVVSDCVKRWFQDTIKEAKAGDTAMQVLVGQMYCSGYGVSRDAQKGRAWINRASRSRSSAWKVSDKRPGYNVSDSDSDDMKDEAK
ncbi:uncharacterized protein LOC132270743 [Cornus florida]|uniref:uncharacterized protein LOC132270743 n=1 Tax=Cornus florida TaxID=4283 RepID=UPI0028999D5A|nr:uncharacterized protein LOC132270743 [Cornus florida]